MTWQEDRARCDADDYQQENARLLDAFAAERERADELVRARNYAMGQRDEERAAKVGNIEALNAAVVRAEQAEAAVERVRAVAERWAGVLTECKADNPRWILDRSVTDLHTAWTDLLAALDGPGNPEAGGL